MSPAYAAFGPYVGNGVYAIFMLGLGAVILAYYLAKRLFDRRIAFIACVFLILADQFRWYSRFITTDGAVSVFFCLAAHVLLLRVLQDPRSPLWAWLLLGQVVGYSVVVRPDNILLLLPMGGCWWARGREAKPCLAKIFLASTGIVFWLAVVLWTNYLYTGDWFRTTYHVNQSELLDRVGGSTSWSYLLNPSFQDSNLRRILVSAPYQWSYFGSDQLKRYFYLVANVFLAAGLVRVITGCKKDGRNLQFLVWMLLWIIPLMLFHSCSFFIAGSRSMQRAVPYLCILDGVGLVTLWDRAVRVRGALDERLRRGINLRHVRYVTMLPFRTLFGGLMVVWGGYVFLHPYCDPEAWIPITAYLAHVNRLIPENDAVVIANCNPFYAEHFLASNSARMLVPLHRLITYADFYVQWKKPPHPEWINEDFPDRSKQWLSIMYKRQRENGAQFIFPYTAVDNIEVIEDALRAGRKVYLVETGVHTTEDERALLHLHSRTDLRIIERGFEPSYEIPAQARQLLSDYYVLRVSATNGVGTELRVKPNGQTQIE